MYLVLLLILLLVERLAPEQSALNLGKADILALAGENVLIDDDYVCLLADLDGAADVVNEVGVCLCDGEAVDHILDAGALFGPEVAVYSGVVVVEDPGVIVVGGYSRHADLHADEGIGNGSDGIVAGVCDDAAGLEEGVDGIGVGDAVHAGVGAVDEVGLVYLRPVGVEHCDNAHVLESVDVVGVNKEDVGYAVASVLAAVHLLRVLYRIERLLDGGVARAVHVDAHTGLVDGRDALVHVVGIPYLVAAPALGAAVGLLVRLKQESGDGFENAVHEELDGTGLEHVAAFVVSVLGLDYLLDLLGALMRVHPVSAAEVYLQLALVVELLYSLDSVGVYVQPGVVCAGEAEGEYLVLIRQNAFLVLLDGEVGQGDQIFMNEVFLKYLTAPTITSGGNPPAFSMTPDGKLTAKNADISGSVNANAGTLNNVTINENCQIKGKLSANQIEGDIVKTVGKAFPRDSRAPERWPSGTITVRIYDDQPFDRQIVIPAVAFSGAKHEREHTDIYSSCRLIVKKNGAEIYNRTALDNTLIYSGVIDMPAGHGHMTLEFSVSAWLVNDWYPTASISDLLVVVMKKATAGISIS